MRDIGDRQHDPLNRASYAHLKDSKRDKIDFLFEVPPQERMAAAVEADWYDAGPESAKNYFAHGPDQSWVISLMDDTEKKSEGFSTCTGVLTTARDVDGKVISRMIHAYHERVLPNGEPDGDFKEKFEMSMREFKTDPRIVPGTIDAVIFGGKFPLDPVSGRTAREEVSRQRYEYVRMAAWLSEEIQQTLGFVPRGVGPSERVNFIANAYFLVDDINGVERGRLFIVPAQLRDPAISHLPRKLFISFPVRNAEQVEAVLSKYIDG